MSVTPVRFVAEQRGNGWLIIAEITGKTGEAVAQGVCRDVGPADRRARQSSNQHLWRPDHRAVVPTGQGTHIAYPGLSPNHDVGGFRMTPFNRASSPGRF